MMRTFLKTMVIKEFIFRVNRIRELTECGGKIEIDSEYQGGDQEVPGNSLHQVPTFPVTYDPSDVFQKSVLRTPWCIELGVGDKNGLLNFWSTHSVGYNMCFCSVPSC